MSGSIHQEAYSFLESRGTNYEFLDPFLETGFDVTWAKEQYHENARIIVCFLKPDQSLIESYGFEYELLLAYSPFRDIQPRALRAVEDLLDREPAKGRVEGIWYFLVSDDKDVESWVRRYLTEHEESLMVVPFSRQELEKEDAGEWTIRNRISDHFHTLDRFKYTLPLEKDTYFFGRSNELGTLLDLVRRGENSGLFGLRKTGKTSVLLKLKRVLEGGDSHAFEIIDAQSPATRKRHWNQLLEQISSRILSRVDIESTGEFTEISAAEDFAEAVQRFTDESEYDDITLAFDEVEWLSPGTTRDDHWQDEFLDFWQTIRAYQTENRNLRIIIAGVNPSMAEKDRFEGYQNPLFGIVQPTFLAGLDRSETADMVQKIGKVVGVQFKKDAIGHLYEQYGGHPLLTRLACSNIAELATARGEEFPITVTEAQLQEDEQTLGSELVYYVRHVVSELEDFYPEEYSLLEQLATGDYVGFKEEDKRRDSSIHLYRYGVVSGPDYPYITYRVIKDYVAQENARREGRDWDYKLIDEDDRPEWLRLRMSEIVDDLRNLESLIKSADRKLLYGTNSFAEAERLFEISPPSGRDSFDSAIGTLYRCLVESIDNYGESIGRSDYFWSVIQDEYPDLHEALHRIRVYRHNVHHLELTGQVERSLRRFLEMDLDDQLAASDQKYWGLFQKCLDELFRAIQIESDYIQRRL